jgi:hypothetical protein
MRFYRSYNALIPRLQSGAGLKNIGVPALLLNIGD